MAFDGADRLAKEVAITKHAARRPQVDVVVPCYNYGRFLRQCVQSVLAQEGVDVRALIIDDASSDHTPVVAASLRREDPRVNMIRHDANRGHISTYNEGIEWTARDYMLLLSADDYLLPGALKRATGLMEQNPAVGFTFGPAIELRHGGPVPDISAPATKPGATARVLAGLQFIEMSGVDNPVATCTAVVRTSLQKALGGYRPELPHAGDMEMWLRFAAHGSVGYIPEPQGVYRRHRESMSAQYYFTLGQTATFAEFGRLADLSQRRSALDCFFERCGSLLPHLDHLRREKYGELAAAALRDASTTFNEGRMAESRQLAQVALTLSPELRRSRVWARFACKRWIGVRTWNAMRFLAATIRPAKLPEAPVVNWGNLG